MSPELDWPSLFDALLWVERLGATECGLLSFGAAPSGAIFVEKNRICWAAARGLERRLRELLRDRAVGHVGFERALRRHSAESLQRLCSAPTLTSWSSRRGTGYAPRVTFRPVDLLFDVVEAALPGARARAWHDLSPLLGDGRRGASFHLDAREASIVPLTALAADSSVESLRRLGHWAQSFRAATLELAALPSFTLATTAEGDTAFVWWRESLLFVVLCSDRASAASVAAHHLGLP